jgi:hypothetical protein
MIFDFFPVVKSIIFAAAGCFIAPAFAGEESPGSTGRRAS